MNNLQRIVVLSSVALLLVLYFGFDTKPRNVADFEKARSLKAESTDIKILLKDAKSELSAEASASVLALETELARTNDTSKVEVLKNISSVWYQLGRADISGAYAEELAKLDTSAQSWSIAGTTYSICLQRTKEEKIRNYCSERAIRAFESAISIEPEEAQHKVNLALCYTEMPPKDNPMAGVQILLDLVKKEPKNVMVLNTLARLGIKTNQFEKAKERLEIALAAEPNNVKSNCLMAELYEKGGMVELERYKEICIRLSRQ